MSDANVGDVPDGDTDVTTLADLVIRAARRDPAAEAVCFPGSRVTYGQLVDRAGRLATGLRALGVEAGDHVGIFMANCEEFVCVLLAAAWVGAVSVPINARYKAKELAYIVRDSDVKVLCTRDGASGSAVHAARLVEALPGLAASADPWSLSLPEAPALVSVVLLGAAQPGFVDADALARRVGDVGLDDVEALRARVRVGDPALLLYTSGTSANPKGCLHTHEAIVRNAIETSRTRFCLTSADRFWDPLPMFHVGALLPLFATFEAGATFLSMTHIEATAAVEQVAGERASWLFPSFPAIAKVLLDEPTFATRDLSAVRMTMCVGPPATLRALQRALPKAVQISAYGSTETGGVIVYHLPTDSAEQRATTCGKPLRGTEVAIGDVGLGPIGEILVRGYCLLECYYNDPELSARVIDEDGWFHTGDLGSIDHTGQLTYHGRLREMLKVGGENVSPLEVEILLAEHPSIAMAQVVGFPDQRLDEVVAAFVETKDGCCVTADELIEYCDKRIAGFKVPRIVRFVSDWPMSATKVNKRRLIEILQEDADPGVGKRELEP